MKVIKHAYWILKVGVFVPLVLVCLSVPCRAHADTMLLASTDMVTGTSAETFSFTAPSAGTITTELTTIPWPVPLSSLSLSTTSANSVLSSWAGTPASMTGPQVESFQVGAGTYFAHVTAAATGSLDLGLYSLLVSFTPSVGPVPLPASDWMLIIGVLVLFALTRMISMIYPLHTFRVPQGVAALK